MPPRSKVLGLDSPPWCCSASSSSPSSSNSGSSSASSCASSSGLRTPEWSAYGSTYANNQVQYRRYYDASNSCQRDPGAPMDVSHKVETSPFLARSPMLIELPAPPPLLLPLATLAVPSAVSHTLPGITFQLSSPSDPIAITGNQMHRDDGFGRNASQTPTPSSATPTRSPLGKLLDDLELADTAELHGSNKDTAGLACATASGASTRLPAIPTSRRHRRGRSASVHLLWRSSVTEEGWEVLKKHYEMNIGAP